MLIFSPLPPFPSPSSVGSASASVAVTHLTSLAHAVLGQMVDVQVQPDTSKLPGGQVLQNLMNGLDGWALALSLVALVIGAAAWALGSHAQNYQQSYVGRRAVLISGLAALLIGAGPAIVNFFYNAGQGVH
jgi:MFS family permease